MPYNFTNINWFQQFFYWQNQETICNETVTIDPTTPQVCRCTTSWNIRWRIQAGDATDQLRDQRWWNLACGPKQTGFKSGRLCCSGCPSTDGLSVFMIHNNQLAKESHCRWVGQSAAAFGWYRHWSVVLPFGCIVQQQHEDILMSKMWRDFLVRPKTIVFGRTYVSLWFFLFFFAA